MRGGREGERERGRGGLGWAGVQSPCKDLGCGLLDREICIMEGASLGVCKGCWHQTSTELSVADRAETPSCRSRGRGGRIVVLLVGAR